MRLQQNEGTGKGFKCNQCNTTTSLQGFLDGPNETFYSPYNNVATNAERRMLAAAPTVPIQQSGLIIDGRTLAVFLQNAKTALNKGGITHLVVELCASHNSELTATVPPRCAAIRVTARDDLTFQKTYKVLRDIIRHALKLGVHVLTWASAPCAAGCPWQRVNRALGRASGGEQMTNVLIQNATKLCKLTLSFGGYFAWE